MMSFKAIADVMDPLAGIGSLRELAARHRWEMAAPPSNVSLAHLAARHIDPTTTRHRVLWFNTYLIHGFELTLCNLLILGRLAEKAGIDARSAVLELDIDPVELAERMGISDNALVDAFGIDLTQLKDTFGDVVDGIIGAITGGTVSISDILDEIGPGDIVRRFSLGVEEIMDRVGLDPLQILVKFCELALGLISDRLHLGLTGTYYATGAAPQRPTRSKEIGAMIGAEYDVAALCEVFEPDRQSDVQTSAAGSGRGPSVAKGAAADAEFASSGLMNLAFDGRLVSSEHMVFDEQGDKLRDADAWSRKGVLRTVLDLGHGRRVELYSTHLFNGGGILEFDPSDPQYATLAGLFPKITPEERLSIQLQQVDDAVAFIDSTHKRDHVAILVGDFNIDANDPGAYGELVERIGRIGLIDLWPFWAQRGLSMREQKPRGDTTHADKVCDPSSGPFCKEPAQPGTSERIDYIFVEWPQPSHPFVLDVTCVRRRPFPRSGGGETHLSDHLGLDITLIASPRAHIPA